MSIDSTNMDIANNKVTVIGSGLGGISSALRFLAKGYEVQILEAGDQPGGRARVFKQKGYTFDAGPTVMTAPYLFTELFDLFSKDMEDYLKIVPVEPFYRIMFDDGTQFDYSNDETTLLNEIKKFNPKDVENYKKLAKHSERIFDVGYTQLADKAFLKWQDMAKVIPKMMKLQNYKSVYQLVSTYIEDKRLRQALTFEPLLVGGNPFHVTSIYMLIHWLERKWGVHHIVGGTNQLVKSLCQLFTEHGGIIHYNKLVTGIATNKRSQVTGVECKDGSFYDASSVVCNSDPTKVYSEMINPKQLKRFTPKKVLKKTQSMSLFVTYFGTKKTYPNIKHHTILLGPRYKELLKEIFDKKTLAEDFSLYLHAPTRTDSTMAPEGSECFYVLSPVPNNLSSIDWASRKMAYESAILDSLEERLLPGLKENLEVCFSITPDYFEKELHSHNGAAFGIAPTLRQSAYFRYHNRCPDIKGLYFVGANTHPGAGVPGVLNTSKAVDHLVPESKFPFEFIQPNLSAKKQTTKSSDSKLQNSADNLPDLSL